MRRLSCLFLFFALALGMSVSAGEEGFKSIFNGKDFTGWQPKGKKMPLDGKTEYGRFKVIDGGVVHLVSPGKGETYLETAKNLPADVIVKFEFKPGPKCNNDFFLRGIKFDIVPGNKECKNVKDGEWNTLEIIAKGDSVEHKINGELARKSKSKAAPSPFIMRAETGQIYVKNIRVKEGS